jgi:hypothetical protein
MSSRTLVLIEIALFLGALFLILQIAGFSFDLSGGGGDDTIAAGGDVDDGASGDPPAKDEGPTSDSTTPPLVTSRPDQQECGPPVDGEFFIGNQVLSYYGSPHSQLLGILGELQPQELVDRLREHAALYDELNGPRGVQPAFHIVYALAQNYPGEDGLYLRHVDEQTLQTYIDVACRNKLLVFLDLQIGRSEVKTEIERVIPFLRRSHVHLALDPEFAVAAGEVPGESIGSLDAEDINLAQRLLQELVEREGLPDKVLIVHQFDDSMITDKEMIEDFPRVRFVIDMDGLGPKEVKQTKYQWYAAPAEYSGIKLFFRQDVDLMDERDVLKLRPNVIIYQ